MNSLVFKMVVLLTCPSEIVDGMQRVVDSMGMSMEEIISFCVEDVLGQDVEVNVLEVEQIKE